MNLEVARKWVESRGYSADKVFNENTVGKPRISVSASGWRTTVSAPKT